jgi:hypothetical protein
MNRLGQIWVETAIYTLIAFALIGTVLMIARPKIQEMMDKATIEQSIDLMKQLDDVLLGIKIPGNQRVPSIKIKEGLLEINQSSNLIIFQLEEMSHMYGEVGTTLTEDNLNILTQKFSGKYKIIITRNYSSMYDLFFDGNEMKLTKSTTPYNLVILNNGTSAENKSRIIFNLK